MLITADRFLEACKMRVKRSISEHVHCMQTLLCLQLNYKFNKLWLTGCW